MTRRLGAALATMLMACGGWVAPVSAAPTVIDFEVLPDLESVTTQFAGVKFTNALALSAGMSLNEFEFPPYSGGNVVSDDGGAMTIVFFSPMTSVAGYFTYMMPLTIEAFDLADVLLGTETSAFGSNLALSGEALSLPNELLGVDFASGIRRVVITGDQLGSSFTLDDLTFESMAPSGIPEPSSLALLAVGLLGMRRRRQRAALR